MAQLTCPEGETKEIDRRTGQPKWGCAAAKLETPRRRFDTFHEPTLNALCTHITNIDTDLARDLSTDTLS